MFCRRGGRCRWRGSPSRLLVSAVLARGVWVKIALFFWSTEIAAKKTLLFFQESATMDILTIRGARGAGATLNGTDGGKGDASGQCSDY